jgi:hypothetical protein
MSAVERVVLRRKPEGETMQSLNDRFSAIPGADGEPRRPQSRRTTAVTESAVRAAEASRRGRSDRVQAARRAPTDFVDGREIVFDDDGGDGGVSDQWADAAMEAAWPAALGVPVPRASRYGDDDADGGGDFAPRRGFRGGGGFRGGRGGFRGGRGGFRGRGRGRGGFRGGRRGRGRPMLSRDALDADLDAYMSGAPRTQQQILDSDLDAYQAARPAVASASTVAPAATTTATATTPS